MSDANRKACNDTVIIDLGVQYIYLDFDGENTVYRNRDLGLDFAVTVDDSGFSEMQRHRILAELEAMYADRGIVFTLSALAGSETDYSTVYIGKCKDFEQYGAFYGLAEAIDVNNQIHNDNAFVFLDNGFSEAQVISVISHEVDHIAQGLTHTVDATKELTDYAAKTYLLSTTWGQSNPYNKYCPVDPQTKVRCLTGCSQTAAGQIIYYWIKSGNLDFSLTLNADDEYDSFYKDNQQYKNGMRIKISADQEDVQWGKYLDFASTNKILRSFSVKNENSKAALCWAAGVIQQANYSSNGTGATWNPALFIRSGFENTVRVYQINASNYIKSSGGLSNSGLALAANEIIAGRPVGVSITSSHGNHAIVADGYDSSTGRFHLNFGWNGQGDGWYDLSDAFTDSHMEYVWRLYRLVSGIIPRMTPSLTVSALSFSSSDLNVNEDFQISFTVTNNGSNASTPTYAYIYAEEKLLGVSLVNSLSAGMSRVFTGTLSSSSLTTGVHTITIKVSTPETGKTNSVSGKLTVSRKQADLQITSLDCKIKGNDLTITYSIKNNGNGNAAASAIKISGVGDDRIFAIPSIKAGETKRWQYTVHGLGKGKYTLELLVDGNNQVVESNESNNLVSKSFTVSVAPDFTPFKPKGWSDKIVASIEKGTNANAKTITADDDIYIDFCAKNIGKANASCLAGTIYVDGVKYRTFYEIDGLTSKATKKWEDINIGKLSAGKHTITVETKKYGGGILEESNLKNNTYSKTITVKEGTPKPVNVDIAIAELSFYDTNLILWREGDSLNYWTNDVTVYDEQELFARFSLENLGSEISSSFSVSILVDGKAVKCFTVDSIGTKKSGVYQYIEDGEIVVSDNIINANHCSIGKLSVGRHTVTIVADSGESIFELNENNNSCSKDIQINRTPDLADLVISDINMYDHDNNSIKKRYDDYYGELNYGDDGFLEFTVRNIGTANAEESVATIKWGVRSAYMRIDPLAIGESKIYRYYFPFFLHGGDTIDVMLNRDASINELSRFNNDSSFVLSYEYVIPGTDELDFDWNCPDLAVYDAILSVGGKAVSECRESDDIVLSFSVENVGSAKCSSVYAEIYVDGASIGRQQIKGENGTGDFLSTYRRKVNENQQSITPTPYDYSINIGTLKAGRHVVSLTIDPDRTIGDYSMENNHVEFDLLVLDASAPVMQGSAVAQVSGARADFTWNNASDANGIAGYVVTLNDSVQYYSSGTSLSLPDLALGTHQYEIRAYDPSGNLSDPVNGTIRIASPDLIVSSLMCSSDTITDKDRMELVFTVANQGDRKADETFIYISVDGDYYDHVSVSALEPGDSKTIHHTFDAGLFGAGVHAVEIQADGENSVEEDNETNNWRNIVFDVLDTTAPVVSNVRANMTAPTNRKVTVTAEFSDNAELASSLYRIGETGKWLEYEIGVTVYQNATVYFKAVDAADNVSEIVSYEVANIQNIAPDNKTDNGKNDYLFDKNLGWNEENIGVANTIFGNEEIFLDEIGSVDKKEKHNLFGNDGTNKDTGDVAKISVAQAANLTFEIKSTAAGAFYVYEDFTDKNGKRKQVTVGKVTVKKNKLATLDVCLTSGDGKYYVAMKAKSAKKGTEGLYNVNVTGSTFFVDSDNGDNDEAEKAKAIAVDRGATSIVLDNAGMKNSERTEPNEFANFVGFSDSVDCAKLDLASRAYTNFNLEADGAAKFTIWKQAIGKSKLTKVSSASLTKKNGYKATTSARFLDTSKYTYYISMESTDAGKGGSAYYKVEVGDKTVFFDSADDGLNNVLYDKKAKEFKPDANFLSNEVKAGSQSVQLDSNEAQAEGYGNFVGYGDAVDYAKIALESGGKLSFTLDFTGDATFTVYRKGSKNGRDALETIQTTKLSLAKDNGKKVTDALSGLKAGEEYYISMTAKSTKATDKGSVFYNVTATLELQNASALEMPTAAAAHADSVRDALFRESSGGLLASL